MPLPILPFGAERYLIQNSLRFRRANSARLSNALAVAGDRKTFEVSCWVKRGQLAVGGIWNGGSSQIGGIRFTSLANSDSADHALNVGFNGAAVLQTNATFRDTKGWYNIILSVDTTQATASERVKLYVNGVQITSFSYTSYPAQNADLNWNTTDTASIGASWSGVYHFDGMIAEFISVSGTRFGPGGYGRFNAAGHWVPRRFRNLYGAKGFHLQFKDASAATAAAIGKDSGPNAINWTPTNISVTAGPTFDQMRDTPTRNVPSWNPYTSNATLAAALLDASGSNNGARATIPADTGKIYFEGFSASTGTNAGFGMTTLAAVLDTNPFWESNSYGFKNTTGQLMNNGSYTTWAAAGTPATDIIQVAFDAATRKLWFGRSGTWLQSGDPASGTNPAFTLASGQIYFPTFEGDNPWSCSLNFGQRPFVYALPAGFTAFGETPRAAPATSGTFTGNASSDGTDVHVGGTPTTLTINGNAVTWGTHAIKTATGFKLITSSSSYNAAGSNSWSATGVVPFQVGRSQFNNAQVN